MVEQSRSRGRAEAWRPWVATGRRPALAWPPGLSDFARRAAQRVREWATAEVALGRLVPWLAIRLRDHHLFRRRARARALGSSAVARRDRRSGDPVPASAV